MLVKTRTLSVVLLIVASVGCGDDSDNATTNNATTNNATTNNATSNNATTNNATTNNVATNNATTNNATTPSQICSLTAQDQDGDGTVETKVKSFFVDENWSQPASSLVVQSGSPFQSSTYLIENEWDEDGNLTHQRVDFGNDGEKDWHLSIGFNDNGDVVLFQFDNDYDGEWEYVESLTHDEFGQMTRMERDGVMNPETWQVTEDADGRPNTVMAIEWRGQDQPLHQEFDTDNDGDLEYEMVWTYDADGNVTKIEQDGVFGSNNFDDLRVTADGTMDVVLDFTYDAEGNMLTERQDGFWIEGGGENGEDLLESADGTPDFEKVDIVTDANGNQTGWRSDGRRGVDGSFSIRADGTFDRFQNVTYQELDSGEYAVSGIEVDEGDDGTVDFTLSQTHNGRGELTHREVDGVIDDGNNILTAADGTPQDTLDISWFEAQRPLSYTRDFDGDGNLDVDVNWTYDDDGNMTLYTRDGQMPWQSFEFGEDGPADGALDHRVANTFDELGRPTGSVEERNDGDGNLEVVSRMEQEWGACDDLEP